MREEAKRRLDAPVADGLLLEFLAETVENLQTVERCVAMDETPGVSADAVAAIFRMMRAINATARFMDVPRLAAVAGAAEGLAAAIRGGEAEVAPRAGDLLMLAVRRIGVIARGMPENDPPGPTDDAELIRALEMSHEKGFHDRCNLKELDNCLEPIITAETAPESPSEPRPGDHRLSSA